MPTRNVEMLKSYAHECEVSGLGSCDSEMDRRYSMGRSDGRGSPRVVNSSSVNISDSKVLFMNHSSECFMPLLPLDSYS